jgi:hypothetical protein
MIVNMLCLTCQTPPREHTSAWRRGLCGKCYQAHRKAGTLDEVALSPIPTRDRQMPHEQPLGHRRPGTKGYVDVKVATGLGRRNYIHEHVHVMQQHLGRKLVPGEEVHHKNGVRSDNRWENLELWITSQPSGARLVDLVEWLVEHHRETLAEALAS